MIAVPTPKNLPKTAIKKAFTSLSNTLGKPIQLVIPTVGTRSVRVKVFVKTLDGRSYLLSNKLILKNKPFFSPALKFKKTGTYLVSIFLGAEMKRISVRVKK